MMEYDLSSIITLTDENIKTIIRESVYGYIFVGGTYYGTEGSVYLFTIKQNNTFIETRTISEKILEMSIYLGNLQSGLLQKESIYKCIPEARGFLNSGYKNKHPIGWKCIPYIMGYYCFFPEQIANVIQANWAIFKGFKSFEERMIVGVFKAFEQFETDIVSGFVATNLIKDDSNSFLNDRFGKYPDSRKNSTQIKALLADLLPQDELLRNRTIISYEEIGCFNQDLQEKPGKNVNQKNQVSYQNEVDIKEVGFSTGLINILRSVEINTLGDLIIYTEEEIARLPQIGSKRISEINRVLKRHGCQFASLENAKHRHLLIDDENSFEIEGTKLIRFNRNKYLATVIIPEGISNISREAFGNKTIRNVVIPEGVIELGYRAFWGCCYLEKVSLPKSLTIIEDYCFAYCHSVNSITIPINVQYCGKMSFYSCDSLQEICFPARCIPILGKTNFRETCKIVINDLRGKIYWNFIIENAKILRYLRIQSKNTVVIPNGIKEISAGAFSGVLAKEILIPLGVTVIGEAAFSECKYLNKIILPDSVKEIGDNAFFGCESLEEIFLPIRISPGIYRYGLNEKCKITVIDGGQKEVENLTIHKNILLSYRDADLQLLLDKLEVLLKTKKNNKYYDAYREKLLKEVAKKQEKKVDFPSEVTIIAESAFSNSLIREIVIPEGVREIDRNAFGGCHFLRKITLPQSLERISDYCFRKCSMLKKIVIPNNVKELGYGLFRGCISLEEIYLPETLMDKALDLRSSCKVIKYTKDMPSQ